MRVADWLVQEIRDLLDVSPVGLYEFVSLLSSRHPLMATETRYATAEEALRTLLRTDNVILVWLLWPSPVPQGLIDRECLPGNAYDPPGRERFPALILKREISES